MKRKLSLVYFIVALIFIVTAIFLYFFRHYKDDSASFLFDEASLIKQKFITPYVPQKDKILLFLSSDCEYCLNALKTLRSNKTLLENKSAFILIFNETDSIINILANQNRDLLGNKVFLYKGDSNLFNYYKINSYPTAIIIKDSLQVRRGNATAILAELLK